MNRLDILGAIWRDELLRLTWEAWLADRKSVSWLGGAR